MLLAIPLLLLLLLILLLPQPPPIAPTPALPIGTFRFTFDPLPVMRESFLFTYAHA